MKHKTFIFMQIFWLRPYFFKDGNFSRKCFYNIRKNKVGLILKQKLGEFQILWKIQDKNKSVVFSILILAF